jgi:hypothetical protein
LYLPMFLVTFFLDTTNTKNHEGHEGSIEVVEENYKVQVAWVSSLRINFNKS